VVRGGSAVGRRIQRQQVNAVRVIVSENELGQLLDRLAGEIARDVSDKPTLALVGIRSRGEIIAHRLQRLLVEKHKVQADIGTLDITLYRDDLGQMGYKQPVVRTTEIDFSIDDRVVVLVDDVVKTGRSTRAAIDALLDFGRPRVIRMAALIDRGYRELPICVDYVGKEVDTEPGQRVYVCLHETDDKEEVMVK